MIDHLRSMAIFRAVVQAGSFRAAAKTLNLSASVVSHHIAQLEQQMGMALLYRSTRRLSLTDAGEELFVASDQMVAAAEAGLNALRRRTDQPSGRLRVAVTGAVFENPPFFDHLAAFARTYPRVALSISFSDQIVDLVGSPFDVAVRIGWLEDSRYKARKLADVPRALVAAPDYVARRPIPKTIADLAGWDWIKLRQLPIARQLTSRQGETPEIDPPVAVEVDSVAAMRRFALAGAGIAALPRVLVAGDIQEGRLVALVPGWALMAPGLYAVWPDNAQPDSLAARFVAFMVERLSVAQEAA